MRSLSMDTETMDWMQGSPFYGPGAIYDDRDVVQLKVLSDPRAEGGGIAWLVRFTPPEGKVIRIVAVALSDEHIFGLEGGCGRKTGERPRAKGNYGLNPKGKPHSAFIGSETNAPMIYNGEPDEIVSLDIVDKSAG